MVIAGLDKQRGRTATPRLLVSPKTFATPFFYFLVCSPQGRRAERKSTQATEIPKEADGFSAHEQPRRAASAVQCCSYPKSQAKRRRGDPFRGIAVASLALSYRSTEARSPPQATKSHQPQVFHQLLPYLPSALCTPAQCPRHSERRASDAPRPPFTYPYNSPNSDMPQND